MGKSASRSAKAKSSDAPTTSTDLVARAVFLLTNGVGSARVEAELESKGASREAIEQAIRTALEKIRNAADVDRTAEVGKAVQRLNSMFAAAMASCDARSPDLRTALQIQRELSKLLGLAVDSPDPLRPARSSEDRLALVESYLKPLGLIDQHYPIEEHARVAADIIRTQHLAVRAE